MKKLLFITLLLLQVNAGTVFWNDSYKDALEEAQESHKPILVFMSQAGCHACQYMEDVVFEDKAVSDYVEKNYVAVHLDIYDNDAPKELQVRVTPVFHFLDSTGKKFKPSLMGGKTAPFFIKIIQK